ncbi:MAG: hypothetical protein AAB388_01085 [Patescibacteria group bacterium]
MNKQVLKLGARILENLPDMSPAVLQSWIDNPRGLKKFLTGLNPPENWERGVKDTTHLRFLQSATLAPTKGIVTLAQASDVFTGHIDPCFKLWRKNVADVDTKEALVNVYEMKQSGTFAELFRSVSKDVRSLCLTQGQIKEFPRTHPHLLQQDGYCTFFLFEVNDALLVAYVSVFGGMLEVRMRPYPDYHVWHNGDRHRLVVPQRTV